MPNPFFDEDPKGQMLRGNLLVIPVEHRAITAYQVAGPGSGAVAGTQRRRYVEKIEIAVVDQQQPARLKLLIELPELRFELSERISRGGTCRIMAVVRMLKDRQTADRVEVGGMLESGRETVHKLILSLRTPPSPGLPDAPVVDIGPHNAGLRQVPAQSSHFLARGATKRKQPGPGDQVLL